MLTARGTLLLVLGMAAPLVGCDPPTDLGNPCRLMRLDSNNVLQPIPAGDSDLDPKFDFISTGDSDCEDLVCLRRAGGTYDDSDGNAHGMCSNECLDATDCGEAVKGLQCAQLSFDQKFIQTLCQNNQAECQQYFGDDPNALYCIDPNNPAPGS